MDVSEAIRKRRSIRKFKDQRIPYEQLKKLVDAARLAPMGANKQPLEYLIVDDPGLERQIFQHTKWAGYLDWTPSMEERPRAYIMLLADEYNPGEWIQWDAGLAAENTCLQAVAMALGTCILGAIDRDAIKPILDIPAGKQILAAIGVGVAAHESHIEESKGGMIEYWMDADGDFHVPKKKLDDIIHHNKV